MLLPQPHTGQTLIRSQARRFNWLAAGRRWRKTTLVMSIAAEAAMKGQQILWGAPTYDQVRVGWSEMRHGAARVAEFNQTFMEARFQTGGKVTFRSLDNPDAARGHTADGIILDESGDVAPDAWTEVLRPMLIDTNGWAWCVGSPRGLNWFWREWTDAANRSDAMHWRAPTLGVKVHPDYHTLQRAPHPLENPTIDFAEIEAAYNTMTERQFAQEILAEFVEAGGGVFRNLDAVCVLPISPPVPDHHYVIGVDWALSRDFTVISVIDGFTLQQVAIDRFSQIDYHFQLERLVNIARLYGPIAIVAESNAMGGPLTQDLQRRGLPVYPFTTSNLTKRSAIEELSLAIERGTLKLLADPTQKGELQAYQSETLPSGMIRYAAPSGGHDDTVMALAMAWYAVTAGAQSAAAVPTPITFAPSARHRRSRFAWKR